MFGNDPKHAYKRGMCSSEVYFAMFYHLRTRWLDLPTLTPSYNPYNQYVKTKEFQGLIFIQNSWPVRFKRYFHLKMNSSFHRSTDQEKP